jgi:type III restriction enzyme
MVASYQAEAKQQDLEAINRHEVEQLDGVKNGTIKMNDYNMKDEFKKEVLSLLLSICNKSSE